jgi:hypothetical protein
LADRLTGLGWRAGRATAARTEGRRARDRMAAVVRKVVGKAGWGGAATGAGAAEVVMLASGAAY